jgi:VWFA-related protein
MPNLLTSGRCVSRNSLIVLLLAAWSPKASPLGRGQTTDQAPATNGQQQPALKLRVASNLVVVRVVVRDARGEPIENLSKEDFKLFDNKKEQSIVQFEAETSVGKSAQPVPAPAAGLSSLAPSLSPAAPGRFLALYFDDLSMSDTDVIQARNAADHYLTANLQPEERVGIFTASGESLSDFTDNLKQLHEALFKLYSSPRRNSVQGCPELSDSEAVEILQNPDFNSGTDAWRVAFDEINAHCPVAPYKLEPRGNMLSGDSALLDAVTKIRAKAQSVATQAELRARDSLGGLERIVNDLSQTPGQCSAILVSPGFVSSTLRTQLQRIIESALRSDVVISSIDPKGVAVLASQADIARDSVPSGPAQRNRITSDIERENAVTSVLAEVTEGTGGQYFHSSNDLTAGFRALASLRGAYILAFAPTDVKLDGRFHSLKVNLAEKYKGSSVQARRGYFAARQ